MTLNKYRKYVKWTYDGEKIIKIGKQELYPRVYKRVWDLSCFSADVLKRYGLEPKEYVYIGQSEQRYLCKRKQSIKAKAKNGYSINHVFRQFLISLEQFYKHELKYSDDVIDKILISDEEVVYRCENKEDAKKEEKIITGKYYLLSILEPSKYVLLSDRDSYFKLKNNNGCQTLKLKY